MVTLARPPANAMDASSLNELADVFDGLAGEPDADVTAIVLTGEGRSFSAGLDLKAIQHSEPEHQEELIEALNRAFLTVYSCPRLVVGAVNGHAIAGGLVLALCCDVRLVADVALKVGLAEVRVGVPYPVGAIEVVRHELTPPVARRLVLGGELIGAHEAVELGVFDRVVPAADLLATALVGCSRSPASDRVRADQGPTAQAGDRRDAGRARRTRSPAPAMADRRDVRRRGRGAPTVLHNRRWDRLIIVTQL